MKYEIARDFPTITVDGATLHRIRALRDIGDSVSAGDVGGYIESEANLAHDGDAWVGDDAMVYGKAQVYEHGSARGDAKVYGEAKIYGEARVYGEAQVSGTARVYGEAQVSNAAQVGGAARVFGLARVYGAARVGDKARILGAAHVTGAARVLGDATVQCIARVLGDATVLGGTVHNGTHDARDSVILYGVCDGYSRIVCQVNGVAHIGAGCRWFTLAEARAHWGAYPAGERDIALCLLEGAAVIARLHGWSEG